MEDKLVKSVKAGNVIVMRTDTVYGLLADATNPKAIKKLYDVKGREGKPGTTIASSIEQLVLLGLDSGDLEKAKQYWPGPNSVVLPAPGQLSYLHLGYNSLAVRIPADKKLRWLLTKTGPLATTSANLPGQPVARNVSDAKQLFGVKVSLYVDGGNLDNSKASNIYILRDTGEFNQLR